MKLTAEQKVWTVKYVTQQRDRAEEATRSFREQWKELWQAYQSKQDYSQKASWQSQCFIPKVWMKIERAAGEIKRAMLQTKKLFKFELTDDAEKTQIIQLRTQLLDEQQDAGRMGAIEQQIQEIERRIKARQSLNTIIEEQFKHAVAETNLVPVYSEMVKAAFLISIGIPKIGWDVEKGKATFKHVSALNFRMDPEYEPSSDRPPRYMIEDYEQSLLDLKRQAKKVNAALKDAEQGEDAGPYDLTAINTILDAAPDLEKRQAEIEQKGLDFVEAEDKTLQMWQYWGDIPAENGKGYLGENVMVIIANGGTLVRFSPNPFLHGKAPYVLTVPIVYPHRGCAGNSLAAPVVKMNYVYNNLWNLLIDNLGFSVNKMFQGNPNHLMNPNDRTVYPGKFWPTNVPPGQTAVSELPVTPVHNDILAAMEIIRQDIEEGMSVTRTMEGAATNRKEPLGTTQLKASQSQSFFDVIAWDLEHSSLAPLLEMTYDLYTQYAGYPAREGNFRLRVGGISLMLQVKQMVDRIIGTLGLALKVPQLAERTDLNWLYQRLLDLQSLSDAYVEPRGGNVELSMQQQQAIAARAEADAQRDVAMMGQEPPPQQPQGGPIR